jgi:hypothetical protein
MKFLSVAALIATLVAGAAQAATLTGTFNITAYNYDSQGNNANSYASAAVLSTIGSRANLVSDSFTYTGALSFGTPAQQTVGAWLGTGGGTVTGLDATLAGRQLSSGHYRSTTFFVITAAFVDGFNATITHDDGISVFDDGVAIRTRPAPTTAVNTVANGFNGGAWSLYYVAANGNPSILVVDADRQPTPVPVPAALPLLAAGLGAFAFFRRRAARA